MSGRLALAKAHVRSLFPPPLAGDLLEMTLPAARARAASVAALLFVGGFVLDDVRVLRAPGFLVGVALALLYLAFGSTLLSRAYARRLLDLPRPEAKELSRRWAARNRLGLVAAGILAAAWLILSGGGSAWLG